MPRAELDETAEAPDLMTALRESVERSRGGRNGGRKNGGSKKTAPGAHTLEGLSKEELDVRARKARLAGRSRMSKDELVAALREHA